MRAIKMLLASCLSVAAGVSVANAAEVFVGSAVALTGPVAFGGVPESRGFVLGMEEANEKNLMGSVKVKLEVEDTASERGQNLTLLRKFNSRNALFMVGAAAGFEGAAIAPLANELKFPLLTFTGAPDVPKAGPWSFPAVQQNTLSYLAKFAVGKHKPKSCQIIFGRDNSALVTQKNSFLGPLKDANVAIAAEEGILQTETDFGPLATKIVSSKADCIYVGTNAGQAANIVIALKNAGLPDNTVIFGGVALVSEEFLRTGGRFVEGVYVASDYNAASTKPLNVNFVARFKQKFGREPEGFDGIGYSTAQLAIAALKAAGDNPTRESIKSAFAGLRNIPVVLGDGNFSYDENRNPSYGAALTIVKAGKLVPVP